MEIEIYPVLWLVIKKGKMRGGGGGGGRESVHCKISNFSLTESTCSLAWDYCWIKNSEQGKFEPFSMQILSWGNCTHMICLFNAMGNWFNLVNRLML